jgi:hypothetical protein
MCFSCQIMNTNDAMGTNFFLIFFYAGICHMSCLDVSKRNDGDNKILKYRQLCVELKYMVDKKVVFLMYIAQAVVLNYHCVFIMLSFFPINIHLWWFYIKFTLVQYIT